MTRPVAAVALVLVLFGATHTVTAATPEPRVALVIGNSDYDVSPLANPANDARLIAETLRTLGFQVIEQTDADQKGIRRLLRDFGEALDDAGPESVGLFYFSGHGVQVRGENFLIPTDAMIRRESDVKIEAVSANEVLNTLSFTDNRLNIVILDACRNNPYAGAFRSPGRGLARMNAPRGTLVAYSTGPGDVAVDGEGANSPYTLALSRAIEIPDVAAEQVFKVVRVAVMEETDGEQVPWEESSLTGDFYFNPAEIFAEPDAAAIPRVGSGSTADKEAMFWQSIQDSATDYEAYLQAYPSGVFAPLARARLAALHEAPRLEAERLEAARKAAEEVRRKEAERVAAEEARREAAAEEADRRAAELAFWDSVKNSGDPADYEAYLAAYPEGRFAALARVRAAKKPPTEVAALAPHEQPSAAQPLARSTPPKEEKVAAISPPPKVSIVGHEKAIKKAVIEFHRKLERKTRKGYWYWIRDVYDMEQVNVHGNWISIKFKYRAKVSPGWRAWHGNGRATISIVGDSIEVARVRE